MFTIDFYPATYGDCIWITYGTADARHHILVDGGTAGTKALIAIKLIELEKSGEKLELVVVSHVDRDHIEGILGVFKQYGGVYNTTDFWFNAWKHLEKYGDYESFGAEQGETLSAFIEATGTPWNVAFGGEAVVVPDGGSLPVKDLSGGMRLTLLSPYPRHLAALKKVWLKEILEAGLLPGQAEVELPDPGKWEKFGAGMPDVPSLSKIPFDEDESAANGSSIAFLMEFDNKRVLLAADAHPGTISESLQRYGPGKINLDLFKLSHHGSKGNTSPDLFKMAPATRYAISTSGTRWPHPSTETIARLLFNTDHQKELVFNYRSVVNEIWDDKILKMQYRYSTQYGNNGFISLPIS